MKENKEATKYKHFSNIFGTTQPSLVVLKTFKSKSQQFSDFANDSIQLGSSPLKPTGILTIHDEEYLIIDHNKGPQSFSLLMNFQADGTSLVKILREKLFWNQNDKRNTKTGGRSLMTFFGFIDSPLEYWWWISEKL